MLDVSFYSASASVLLPLLVHRAMHEKQSFGLTHTVYAQTAFGEQDRNRSTSFCIRSLLALSIRRSWPVYISSSYRFQLLYFLLKS